MEDLHKLTDEQIVELVRTEDKEIFREIVERYQNKLFRYARYLVQDEHKAKDIVQESLIKAYVNLYGFDVNKKFSSWMYRIVHNEAVDEIRKSSKTVLGLPLEALASLTDVDHNPSENFEKEEARGMVKRCLAKLPVKYREVLALFYLEEKSYNEISDILRTPMGTVGTRIHRGEKMLRKICGEEKNEK